MDAWPVWSGVIVVGLLVVLHCLRGALRPGSLRELRDPAALPFSSLLAWSALLALVLFIATLPTKPPFAGGQLMGRGFLLGAVLIVISLLVARLLRAQTASGERTPLAMGGCAVATVGIALLVWREQPAPALLGVALAAALFGIILRFGLASLHGAPSRDASRPPQDAGEDAQVLALMLIAGAVATVFARAHFPERPELWPLPVALAAATLLGALAADAVARSAGRGPVACVIGVIVALAAAALVALGLLHQPLSAAAYAVGLVFTGLAAWVLSGAGVPRSPEQGLAEALRVGVIAGLLTVAAYVIAFRIQAGLGACLALIAGLLFIMLTGRSRPDEQAQAPLAWLLQPLFSFGLLFVLYRLFLERIAVPRGADLTVHYVLIGVVLGALTPFVWTAFNVATRRAASRRLSAAAGDEAALVATTRMVITRTAWLGVFTLAPPLLALVLWREQAALGFVVGLLVAQPLLLLLPALDAACAGLTPRPPSLYALSPGLLCVGCALAAAQFSPLLLPLTDMPRLDKAILAGVVAVVLVAWLSLRGRPDADSTDAQEGMES